MELSASNGLTSDWALPNVLSCDICLLLHELPKLVFVFLKNWDDETAREKNEAFLQAREDHAGLEKSKCSLAASFRIIFTE